MLGIFIDLVVVVFARVNTVFVTLEHVNGPVGVGVLTGVLVGVDVFVGVGVGETAGVFVGVCVRVGVLVGVEVRVLHRLTQVIIL